ncbi:hypothetical protein RQP53_14050 [Paucibacter sp. APW11]|uniref:Ferric oxidoreductase domain-containing protein n=1 Tax=Roseateles aquae TaxID=3077235 RepID=A0ABU3PCY7_9BURK|nr:hypothetical protein [Paucibacter sp. APW11]MDT9000393.1 hypothetical protein [Paucibacter sp. APW11]
MAHVPTPGLPPSPPPPAGAGSPWYGPLGSAWGCWLLGTAALLLMCVLLIGPRPELDGVRAQVRATARSSLFFFLLAYTASAWPRLWPGAFSSWLLQRRRQWGLLFASSHALHAAGIVALHALASPALWASLTSPLSLVLGGSGYLVLSLLALSSNGAAQRWLGVARWQRWHRAGSHWLCLLFVLSSAKRVPMSLAYLLPLALLLGAAAIRHLAGRRRSGCSGAHQDGTKAAGATSVTS